MTLWGSGKTCKSNSRRLGCGLHANGGIGSGLGPAGDLYEGLGEGVDDDVGFSAAEAFDGEFGGFGIFGGIPEADDDAVVGHVGADALAEGSGLREGEGRQGGDEDDGAGFGGERVEDLAGDGGVEEDGLVVGALHELDEHEGCEFVGLVAGGDADYGEVVLFDDGARDSAWGGGWFG